MIAETLKFASKMIEEGEKLVLCTITKVSIGSPASVGQIIAICANGKIHGTVGGGNSEHSIILEANKALEENIPYFEINYDLAEKGMICGGKLEGTGILLGTGNKMLIFGGGHVAQKIFPIAKSVGFAITIVEDREEFELCFPDSKYIICKANEIDKNVNIDKYTYVIIATRGHSFDFEALDFCMDKDFAYIGMIGSKIKTKTLYERLKNKNYTKEKLSKIYSPIGLDVDDGSPAEIAVSVMAEIIKIKNNGSLKHLKELASLNNKKTPNKN